MPLKKGRDSTGNYWKWGDRGKKYYYDPKSKVSNEDAKKKAIKQAVAISYHMKPKDALKELYNL